MRLEDYWGIGPKTREMLAESLGVTEALEAIETADVRALTEAGVPSGRATRILRHVHGGAAMEILATRDARAVYKQLLEVISEYAVTENAGDKIRILTPLADREAMTERLTDVSEARKSWERLGESDRTAVLKAFEAFDEAGGGKRAAVTTARKLREIGLDDGVFEPLDSVDDEALADAVDALTGLEGDDRIGAGADDELDSLRGQLGRVEDLSAVPGAVVEEIQSGARGTDQLRESLVRYVGTETGTDVARVRESMPAEAADARGFVDETLRELRATLQTAVEHREAEVTEKLETALADAREDVDTAVEAVTDIALAVSLARFALAFDLTQPEFVDRKVSGVVEARNIVLEDSNETPQPITYAIGEHQLAVPNATTPPTGDSVAVLTGANSGGKTTLLETLCQVQLLAQMGLPVPATDAEISVVDTIVFHRRHASFNAGVLESTLRSVVPPVIDGNRTLMLVDEFEAITEPGSAADLLHGLVTLTVEQDALGVFVTHLADDLEPLPDRARTDGIFAEGLTTELDLQVDYQPRFGTVGRSTPEFIVSRLMAAASSRSQRAGYEHLAEAVGESAVQRTLADAKWSQ